MWQSFYDKVGNPFGIQGHYYGVNGHRGTDFPAPAGTPVPAYAEGTVALIQFSTVIGTCVVIQLDTGHFAGFAHLQRNPPVEVGDKVTLGQTLGYVAGEGDRPGSSWTGPHLHATVGYTVTAIFFGPVYDPLPRIVAATSPLQCVPPVAGPAAVIRKVLGRSWLFWLPPPVMQVRIQRALTKRKRYAGHHDGAWRKLSIKGIQLTIRNVGYRGRIDGIAGKLTCYYVQVYAKRFGGYKGKVDRVLGPYSWLGFARGLEKP